MALSLDVRPHDPIGAGGRPTGVSHLARGKRAQRELDVDALVAAVTQLARGERRRRGLLGWLETAFRAG